MNRKLEGECFIITRSFLSFLTKLKHYQNILLPFDNRKLHVIITLYLLHLWSKFIKFIVSNKLHLWLTFIKFMFSITFLIDLFPEQSIDIDLSNCENLPREIFYPEFQASLLLLGCLKFRLGNLLCKVVFLVVLVCENCECN